MATWTILKIAKQLSAAIKNKQFSASRTETQDNNQAPNLRPEIQNNDLIIS